MSKPRLTFNTAIRWARAKILRFMTIRKQREIRCPSVEENRASLSALKAMLVYKAVDLRYIRVLINALFSSNKIQGPLEIWPLRAIGAVTEPVPMVKMYKISIYHRWGLSPT